MPAPIRPDPPTPPTGSGNPPTPPTGNLPPQATTRSRPAFSMQPASIIYNLVIPAPALTVISKLFEFHPTKSYVV